MVFLKYTLAKGTGSPVASSSTTPIILVNWANDPVGTETIKVKINTKIVMLSIILFIATSLSFAQTTRVLFIGNSLTGANNLPNQFNLLALSAGKQVYVEDATAGGATLNDHLNNLNTISIIQQGNWDYVVLQEQSQLPSWANDRDSMFYPYAKSLDSIIKLYNPCGQTVFFLTYAHRNGDLDILQNGGIDSYWDMQSRIRDGYMEIADSLEAMVSPVGWAFRECRIQYPNIELYLPDFNHPTDTGTYLAACTFYSTLFQDISSGLSYIGNMPQNKATILQNIASQIVMDSLSLWNISPNINIQPTASFHFTDTLFTVYFTDSSVNATTYFWDFGDGSSSTLSNPVHSYQSSGIYTVSLIAYGTCGSDTIFKQINIPSFLPVCGFNYGINNLTVNFTDSSTNALQYLWDFGDGDTSFAINPTHIYLSSGSYLVKHKVINSFGSDSIVKLINVYVQLPLANFYYQFNTSTLVQFIDSSNYTDTYYWDFDDGDTSHYKSPQHLYLSNGIYDVKLIVSNIWGRDSIVKQVDILTSTIQQTGIKYAVEIFPNPAQNEINIITEFKNYNYKFRSYDNKVLLNGSMSGNGKIDISKLASGWYFIIIESEENVIIRKVLKL